MAELDATARYGLKVSPSEWRAWLVSDLDTDLGFRRWLDTETIAFPGEPRRRCDTVAELVSRSGSGPPWALVLEVEAGPRATILDRLLEYVCRLMRKLRHGPRRRDRYQVAAILLVLTGRQREINIEARLPGTDLGLSWHVRVVNLALMKAREHLGRIERGELGRSLLLWLPLMIDGGEPDVVEGCARLLKEEPDEQRRQDCAGLALVFAEQTGCLPVWKKALEGLGMWKSQVIAGWRDEGRLAERKDALLRAIERRYREAAPTDVAARIEQTLEMDTLLAWFDAVFAHQTLDEFAQMVRATPLPSNGKE